MPKLIAVCATVVATLLSVAHDAGAQDLPPVQPRKVQQVTMSPPRDASIRQKSGPARVFQLISLTEEIVTVRLANGKQVEIEMDKVQAIRTRDGSFDYSPEDETFASLLRRVPRISGATVQTVEVYDPIERIAPGEEPTTPDPADGQSFVANPADPSGMPEGAPLVVANPSDPASIDPAMADSINGTNGTPGSVVYTCANCLQDLPAGFQDGSKCPHCGVVFWSAGPPVVTASGSNGATAEAGAANHDPFNVTSTTAPIANDGTTPAPVTTTSGPDFGDAPMWMKVGFFAGLLAIGWILLQRR